MAGMTILSSGQGPTANDIQTPVEPPDDRWRAALVSDVHPAGWRNPKPAGKYNLVIIGAGPGGVTAARQAAALGAKVALIERNYLGGDRLNVGCIPSKAIIRTARLYAEMRAAGNVGAQVPEGIDVGFAQVMDRMRRLQARLGRADSAQRLSEADIDVYFGEARFADVDTVDVAGDRLRFKKALIATGARPLTPPIPGLAEAGYLTNENVFNLTQCPRRLLVIGGGPLGCELAQAFCRFGAHVIIVQDDPMFLPKEERDAAPYRHLQTSNRRIYAAGDVCLEHKFTHAAEASAGLAVRNALFFGRERLSALMIPWCTYTDPEIAHVGLYVREAREKDIPVMTFTILMHDVDRAVTDGEEDGFVKIHVRQGGDRILGATVVARHAGEMINGLSLAITSGIGLRALAKVIHTYPTQADAIKMAAKAYNRTRLTPTLKSWSGRWLAWCRR
jgi:pyruvate/2-oxoglutarate dehydrogenase complex dihydrolipoamide dehydrogenase (E3) component